MSEIVVLVPLSKASKQVGCCPKTVKDRGKTDPRFKTVVIGPGNRHHLRSTQIAAIQQNCTEEQILAAQAGISAFVPKPKPSILDRIGCLELEAAQES
jgi:hypothetical protein